MKMLHYTTSRFSIASAIVLALWSFLFYFIIINEINDETDDSLQDYAETLIIRHLSGETLPTSSAGSNNQFFQHQVSKEYADENPHVNYADRDVYIEEKKEYEPARVLTYIYQDNNDNFYELEVSTPTIDKVDLKIAILQWIVGLYIIIMCCIFIINWWTIRSSIRPLKKLLEWINKYRLGKTNEPLDNPTFIDEFILLNNTAQETMQRNEQIFEEQKTFIGNASHELQTPLAICTNRIEMMMEDESLTENQMKQLVDLHHTIQRMTQLNRSLLMLSRIENGQYENIKNINFYTLVNSQVDDLQTIFENKNIEFNLQYEGEFIHEMDEVLANTLVSNLLRNAFIHSPKGGKITAISSPSNFTITNTATNGSLDENLIYRRFYHRADATGSTGLGLTIAQTICKKSGLAIQYHFSDQMHTFSLLKT